MNGPSSERRRRIARGLNASPGLATGRIVFDSASAVDAASRGVPVIFVRTETCAEDMDGMRVATGLLTTRGGLTCDAAIVARILGKPCVAGCSAVSIDDGRGTVTVHLEEGDELPLSAVVLGTSDWMTIDGSTGEVFQGR